MKPLSTVKTTTGQLLLMLLLLTITTTTHALNIVIPGGTGKVGRRLISSNYLTREHKITILCRNAFLAAAPNRVSGDFGWLGQGMLDRHPHVRLRDWDGGDLLDIVGCDWMGWPEDSLKGADVVINLVGGYTEQRVQATERILRESIKLTPRALHVIVSPEESDLRQYSRGAIKAKLDRIQRCEDMVQQNTVAPVCIRAEMNNVDGICEKIQRVIAEYTN